MKVRTLKRTICLWLCIVLIFTMFSVSFGEEKTGLEESKEANYEFLPIPEVMEDTESIEMAVRIDTDEDALNEIKYYYGGDSIVSFLFPTNVKYVGSDNKTRDKSNKLSEAEDYFTNENNDIVTVFSKQIENGTKLTYKDFEFSLVPIYDNKSNIECIATEEQVRYTNVFGEDTELVYKATFTGNKSDIYLYEKPSTNVFKFQFVCENENISLELVNGRACVFLDGECLFQFDDILITDNSNKKANGEYLIEGDVLSIVVPQEFLFDEETVYPVDVDPSISIYPTNIYYSNQIENTQINIFQTYLTLLQMSRIILGMTGTSTFQRGLINSAGIMPILSNDDLVITSLKMYLYLDTTDNNTSSFIVNASPCTTYWSIGSSVNTLSLYSGFDEYGHLVGKRNICLFR